MAECITPKGNDQSLLKPTEISEELESLVFRFFDILQSIIYKQDCLQVALKDGHVHMAKARYIMGSKCVGTLQISERDIEAKYKVWSESNHFGNAEYINFKVFEKCNQAAEKHEQPKIRHRKVKNLEDLDKTDISVPAKSNCDKNAEQKNENCHHGGKNPLQWFGVLVPQNLRTCQSRFVESLDIIVELASLKSELSSVCVKYQELLAMEMDTRGNVLSST